MPSVEERLRYWRTRAQRMQVALEDIATDEVQSHSDDELGLIQRMQDTARGVLGDDPSEFDKLRANIASLTTKLEEAREAHKIIADMTRNCHHDGGYDRDFGPVGCMLGDKCVCIGIHPVAIATLDRIRQDEEAING